MRDASTPPPDAGTRTAEPVTPQPGEVMPTQRRLAHPPGERYRTPPPRRVQERPDVARALALGLGAGLATATLIAVFHAILSITAGLLAIAILGGWLIGLGVRQGAWSGRPHRPSRAPGALAAGLGLATWVGGLVASWLLSMAILPGSGRSFPERLVATPFLEWVAPQIEPLHFLTLAVITSVAWVASRSPGVEWTDDAGPG
jgi:hypothetical protein